MPRLAIALILLFPTSVAFGQTNVLGWHAAGQTWIVWDELIPQPSSVRIYASTTDFVAGGGSTAVGFDVGHLLPADWEGFRLQLALPGATYLLPGPGGASYPLAPNQGVFAYTSHDTTPLYFAVVEEGVTTVTAANSTGSIPQTLAPVQIHWQGTTLTPSSGQTLHVYAHWVDGHSDHSSGRPDYPIMGNASMNGCGQVFLVTMPLNGPPASDVPLAVALHGGGGLFMNLVGGESPNLGLAFQDALLLSPDGTVNSVVGIIGAAWLGYWEDFDRFTFPFTHPLPNDALVVDYMARRLLWQIDQVSSLFPVDVQRISLLGNSGGARGAGKLARVYPERFAAIHQFNPPLKTGDQNVVFGDVSQNLTTTLPGFPGVADLAQETFFPSQTARDLPFTRITLGRNDLADPWTPHQVQAYHDIDASRMGRHLFFDGRGHGTSEWTGAWFNGSTMLRSSELLRYRVDQSYPAFFADDQDPAMPGIQPDLGNGEPTDGDPYGTYGGYCDWDQTTLVDTPEQWECTFWLRGMSALPQDNFPGVLSRVSLAVRRPQLFLPAPLKRVDWSLHRLSDGSQLRRGTTTVERDGLVVVENLFVSPDPDRKRLVLTVRPGLPGRIHR
jgi:hypothetical protein